MERGSLSPGISSNGQGMYLYVVLLVNVVKSVSVLEG